MILEARHVTHLYKDVIAVDDVSISAQRGEFLTLLGPSGSGKTTFLRVVAGLEAPTRVDTLRIDGHDVRAVPAHHRNVSTVFQHYALFPNMSVGQNIEFGLRVRGVPANQREQRVTELLELVQLPGISDRRVHQLSAGQRQRVALARALAPRPAILLLDEPLAALDEKLRGEMQIELLDLQKALAMTFIYVTHSREEALTMSDRIIIMCDGKVVQKGRPSDVFRRPASRFVADFVGIENIFDGSIEAIRGEAVSVRVQGRLIEGTWSCEESPTVGMPASIAVRADRVELHGTADRAPENEHCLPCRFRGAIHQERYLELLFESDVGLVKVRRWNDTGLEPGRVEQIRWARADCVATRRD